MIDRKNAVDQVRVALRRSRVVAIVGPRQSGKTTLARQFVSTDSANYFDLEDPASLEILREPKTALERLRGVVVIDEIQRRPELFPILRVLTDRRPLRARFLVLGSASGDLLRQTSESLAGRLTMIELGGFHVGEIAADRIDVLWRRGGFPRSFLARSEAESRAWREQFLRTYASRDLPELGLRIPSHAIQRFLAMLAHYHAQIWNAADPARSLGVNESTVRRYLDILTDTFLVRQLQPWFENLGKRQVKAPKVYLRDPGLLNTLLGIRDGSELLRHPKLGASYEGHIIEQVLALAHPAEAYFWATHNGAEIDLLFQHKSRRIGVEVKRADAPSLTPSMRIAMNDLRLDRLYVVYPGDRAYELQDGISVLPEKQLLATFGSPR